MLGGVKSSVGKLNQIALELCVSIINRHANTDCKMLDRVRRAGKKFSLVHGAAQALGHKYGAGLRGFRQDDHKLLAAVSGHRVYFSHIFHQDGGNVTEELVAYVMAKGIVQHLEVIDIDHQQGKLLLFTFSALELQLQLLLKITTCAQAGKVVGKGKAQQAFIGV